MKWLKRTGLTLIALLIGPLLVASCSSINLGANWRTADRSSTGLAPNPYENREAVVQVYAARAFNWRGIFAVHTWVATKPENASDYTVHQVLGWRQGHGMSVVVSRLDAPDRAWYGNRPELVAELRGDAAARAIPRVLAAVSSYPYPDRYVMWPGPNSNTFVAHVAREVPELRAEMPALALGKDYLPRGALLARSPSGTGFQLSLFGLLGATAGLEEGLEVNVLGLVVGVDPLGLAVKLPGVGRVGAGRI